MNRLLMQIVLTTLPLSVTLADDFVKPEASMFFVLDHSGQMVSRLNKQARDRYTLHCLRSQSYILVEPEESIVYRFPETKNSTARQKCEALETKLVKHGAGRKYEVEINPSTGFVIATKELIVPPRQLRQVKSPLKSLDDLAKVVDKILEGEKRDPNKEKEIKSQTEAALAGLSSEDLALPLEEINKKLGISKKTTESGSSK